MLSSMSAAATVVVTKLFIFNISKTVTAGNFEICNNVAFDSLYILTGSVVTIYNVGHKKHTKMCFIITSIKLGGF